MTLIFAKFCLLREMKTFVAWQRKKKKQSVVKQGQAPWSEQLLYQSYVTAFLWTILFFDTF